MTTETEITRFIPTKDIVTPYKTLETAAKECDAYDWMRAGSGHTIIQHGDKAYVIIEQGDQIACSCNAWTFAHGMDCCKHIVAFLKRSKPAQKPITDEIARDLMAAGWTGCKGNLQAPAQATSDEDGEDNGGSDPVPDRAPKPTPPPEPTIKATCQHCGKTFERKNAANLAKIVREHEASCKARPKGEDVTLEEPAMNRTAKSDSSKRTDAKTATVEEEQKEETKMAEPEPTKTYTHPDGQTFEIAEHMQ